MRKYKKKKNGLYDMVRQKEVGQAQISLIFLAILNIFVAPCTSQPTINSRSSSARLQSEELSSLNSKLSSLNSHPSPDYPLNLRLVYDFATTAPLEEINFIMEARTYNMNAAREALKGNYGHNLGKSIHNLTSIGADTMCKTDDMVLNIMTSKDSK